MLSVCLFLAMLMMLMMNFGVFRADYWDSFSGRTFSDIRFGTMQHVYLVRAYTVNDLALQPEGSDAVCILHEDMTSRSMIPMGISSNPSDFYNISAASVFHLNSVSVIYE